MSKSGIIFLILLLILSLPMSVHATDLPYHNVASPNNCGNNFDAINSGITGLHGVIGTSDTDFTGQNVISIGLYLCVAQSNNVGAYTGVCPLNANDTSTVTIGIFSTSTGSLIKSYGTPTMQSLQCVSGNNQASGTPKEVTFSGSHVMVAGEMIGFSFSRTGGDVVFAICAGGCLGTEIPHGTLTECTGATCTPNTGFGLAGDFLNPLPSLCNKANSGAIIGASSIIVIMALLMGQSIGEALSRGLNIRRMKIYMQIIVAVAVAILVSTIILGQLPAGIGAGC